MCYSRVIVFLSISLFGCSNATLPQKPSEDGLTLNVEEAAVVRVEGGDYDLKVSVRTANRSEAEYCEVAGYIHGETNSPLAYFAFTDPGGSEIYFDAVRPQFSGSPFEPQTYRILRRAPGSVSVDEYFAWGDLVPSNVKQGSEIRIKAARFVFSCTDETGEPLPKVFSVSDKAAVKTMEKIFSHFNDRLIFSPESPIEAAQ